MKLAFLSPCFSGRHYGGVQLSARLALEGLCSGTNDVRFLCYGPDCAHAADLPVRICSRTKAGAALEALKNRTWPDRLLFWHADMLKLMPLIGARGRPNVLFLHGIECWKKIDGAVARGLDEIDLFLSNSDFTWQRFIEANPRWAAALHATVALGVGVPEPRDIVPSTIPAAVMIGRMAKGEGYKGHEEVIRAWPRVSRAVPGAELWIAGGGDAAADLISLAAASEVADRIRFFGIISDADKDRLLRQSRCLVLPSRGEGFGLVYLEAMRLGRPCLASVHDAGKEVVEPPHAGLAANPENPDDLAHAIARLLTPGPEWDAWSHSARERYESAFTAAHFQRRLRAAINGEPPQ